MWDLPKAGEPGSWSPRVSNPCLCYRGYHLSTLSGALFWEGEALFVAEGRGQRDGYGSMIAYESARLVRRVGAWIPETLRVFAADCAERALDAALLSDERLRSAVETARRHAEGVASREALRAAAREAADAMADVELAARGTTGIIEAAMAVEFAVSGDMCVGTAAAAAEVARSAIWLSNCRRHIAEWSPIDPTWLSLTKEHELRWQLGRLAQLLGFEPSDVR